jgi:hypothetical protein
MKSILIGLVLASVLVAPLGAKAQTVTQEDVNVQLMVLINSLMTQVQELMVKLIAMQTKQEADSAVLGSVQTSVTTIQQQVYPVVIPAPAPVPKPVIVDKRTSCDNLKVSQWEMWSEAGFATEFGLTYQQESTGKFFRNYQSGGHRGEQYYSCPAYGEGADPAASRYGTAGCQRFISENSAWVACMNQ